ncbi:MAG: flagellar biosynthetic protein FliR [Planctomycetaceae bacterium]
MLIPLLDQFFTPAGRVLLDPVLQMFWVFVLTATRLAGLFAAGPVFGQAVVPHNVRLVLIVALAFVLTPIATPESLAVPDGAIQIVPLVGLEFGLGFILGLGVMTVLSGLQLAGQLIDQQLGTAFAATINPDLQASVSVTGQMFFILGGAALLVMEPVNGDLLMLSALVETFESLPLGQVVLPRETAFVLTQLMHKSMVLGVRVAAPVLAALSLVTLTLGFVGRSMPQINQLSLGFPLRFSTGLFVLGLSLSGILEAVLEAVPEALSDIQTLF